MQKILSLALVLPLGVALLLTAAKPTTTSGGKLTPAQLREDFGIFRQALEEGHGDLYRHTGKAEMDRIFEHAAQELDHPMDAYEFYRVVAPVIASIKCGHTKVILPAALRQELAQRTPLLPLLVKVLDRKVYVLRDLVNADRRLAGREIRSINGAPVSRIVATMLAATRGDGDVMTSRQIAIDGWKFSENLVVLLGMGGSYDVTVVDRQTGREETVHLAGRELPKLQAASEAQGPEYRPSGFATNLEFRDDGKIAVMRIAQFDGDLASFYQDSFEKMQKRKTATLIVDVRNNGGGMDHLGALLVSYFVDKPFDYYSDIYLAKLRYDLEKYSTTRDAVMAGMFARDRGKDGKYHAVHHPTWGSQQPSRPTFRGRVFILINGASFSTTTEFLAHMHSRKLATFIGEEAGGGYYGNTAGFMPVIALPRSQLEVRVPLLAYYLAVSPGKPASHGVMPDHPVQYTIEDVMAGKDLEMQLALRLARRS